MVARSKVVTAKWSVPSKEPEDLPDFLSNDEIVDKAGGLPRGVFRVWVKQITVNKNKNDDDMLRVTAEIFETDKSKKVYNGYTFWENQNVTESGAAFLKRFLNSMGATWKDFNERTKMVNATTLEPTKIISIGSANFNGAKKVLAVISTKIEEYKGEERAAVSRWLPPKDSDEAEVDGDDDDLGEGDEDLEEVEEEAGGLEEELDGLTLVELRKRAKENDPKVKTIGLKKDGLIELIIGQESLDEGLEEEELEDDDDDAAEEELREELAELELIDLKRRAKGNGEKVAVLKPIKDKDKLIDIIVEQELSAEADDNEPPF